MNIFATSELRPGLIFTKPVYTIDNNMLVPAKIPLRQKDIDLLRHWGIESVSTEGIIITEEELKEEKKVEAIEKVLPLEEELPPEPIPRPGPKKEAVHFSISDVQQNSGPYKAYKNLIDKLDAVFTGLSSDTDVEMRMVNNICTQLLQEVRDNRDSFIDYILGGEVIGREIAKSSVNTAILSALTAQELRLPNHKILHIVAAALLHDVGMLRLSKFILEKKGQLSDAELEQVKSHPMHTSKIITKELFGPHEVNNIALQHHERWDGKGYPDQLIGPAIDLGARIISVADAFEAMVCKKAYRNSMVGYQAVKNILADNSRRFDPAVIQAFTRIMGIYPIGSILRLNNGTLARVIKIKGDAPLRPSVQMLTDEKGNVFRPGKGEIRDLLNEKNLYIKEAIDPAEYNKNNA
jgi:HD-GYP domain-containing protein (c-di-GMP phosphodiesterase class II)